ncbi:MFS transporter [Kitasatospora aburaviensis]
MTATDPRAAGPGPGRAGRHRTASRHHAPGRRRGGRVYPVRRFGRFDRFDRLRRGPGTAGVRHNLVLLVTCLALATVVAAMASLNVALPEIARATHGSQTELSWIIDAYSLVFAALLLPAGALGDRFGRRRALLVGLALFGGGSGLAALTTDATALIALRGLLGVGAALVMPATLSTITGTFPRAQRTKAVSVWAAVAGASAVVGLLASGTLLELWSWRSVFLLNVLLAVAALVGTLLVVPESADPDAPRLDLGGAVLAATGLGVLVYAVIEAPTRGWGIRSRSAGSRSGSPCWPASSAGSCGGATRCWTRGCSATAGSRPARSPSPASSSPSSATSS